MYFIIFLKSYSAGQWSHPDRFLKKTPPIVQISLVRQQLLVCNHFLCESMSDSWKLPFLTNTGRGDCLPHLQASFIILGGLLRFEKNLF